jgi:hypothetical protein
MKFPETSCGLPKQILGVAEFLPDDFMEDMKVGDMSFLVLPIRISKQLAL